MASWIFQSSPEKFDLLAALEGGSAEGEADNWLVRSHRT